MDSKADLAAALRELLKHSTKVAAETFGNTLPKESVTIAYMVPTGPNGHQGRQDNRNVLNWFAISKFALPTIKTSECWKVAHDLCQKIAGARRSPTPYPWDNLDNNLACIIGSYFERADKVIYDSEAADQEVIAFLQFLASDLVEFICLASLDNFTAAGPLELGKGICIRPITEAEVFRLGRVNPWSWWDGHRYPQTDWWVLEIQIPNPKVRFEAHNSAHKILDSVALALRMFKPGNIQINLESVRSKSSYGSMGEVRGGRPENLSINAPDYCLSQGEVDKFIAFWPKFHQLAEQDSHFLQLPARRLRQGGMRILKEDALVDYMIGLEALLGKSNERVEIGYRFKVRGSVLLSETIPGRRALMKKLDELYGLRSTVVHGEPVTPEKLSDALPFAEDSLRKVWRWYFENAADEANNKASVDRIDEDLFGPR